MFGASQSSTSMLNEHESTTTSPCFAVHVTFVVATGKAVPEAGSHVTTTPSSGQLGVRYVTIAEHTPESLHFFGTVGHVSVHCGQVSTVTLKDRKSTRLNSSHLGISYAVFC